MTIPDDEFPCHRGKNQQDVQRQPSWLRREYRRGRLQRAGQLHFPYDGDWLIRFTGSRATWNVVADGKPKGAYCGRGIRVPLIITGPGFTRPVMIARREEHMSVEVTPAEVSVGHVRVEGEDVSCFSCLA